MMCLGLQSSIFLIWAPSEAIELEIPFDQAYTQTQVQYLQHFYFTHMLPKLADDFEVGKFTLCQKYLDICTSQ